MKRFAKTIISIAALSMCFSLAACGDSQPQMSDFERQTREIYESGLREGSIQDLTYEEWLESIKGKDGKDGQDGKDGHSPVVHIGDNGHWFIDDVDTGISAQGPQGNPGNDGVSVVSIELTSSSNNVDTYTIKYSDGNTSTFTVTNGSNGSQGIQGNPGKDGHTPEITISSDGYWMVDGVKTTTLAQGPKGDTGVSVVSIIKTSKDGLVDTYTITFSDGHTSTFTVTNGSDGSQGIQGNPGQDGHTPVITIGSNGNWYVDDVDSGIKAQGPQGEKGDDGLSAYEIYIKYHPEYTGTEEEWLEDLVNGNLREKYTVTFKTNGGSAVESQKVSYGHLVTRPLDPVRTGYIFTGWYLNGEVFPFNSFQVFDDITIYATWKSVNIQLTLDANGGDVEYNIKTVTYGIDYALPIPIRGNYYFEGWYYNETELCPLNGVWFFSKDDITLKARWSGTQANITFAEDDNVCVSESSVTVEYGSYFSLPVPTILSGDPFIGWADDNDVFITDSLGDSIKKSSFKEDVTLHAVYYYEIYTVNDWLKLCSYSAGDPKLSCTYVLMNDLDFTGLSNASVSNFEGTINGNGFRVVGMSNPMFASIGRTSSSEIIIKDIVFVNFSGTCIINTVNSARNVNVEDIMIFSFAKDLNDYCDFNGIVNKVDSGFVSSSIKVSNCYIEDEFATINTGFINSLYSFRYATLENCYVKSNTNNSAFINGDRFSGSWIETSKESSGYYSNQPKNNFSTDVIINYCSNFGNTTNLVRASSGSYYAYYYINKQSSLSNLSSSFGKHNVKITNVCNYGNVSDSLFLNTYNITGVSYTVSSHIDRSFTDSTFQMLMILNFGNIGSIVARKFDKDGKTYPGNGIPNKQMNIFEIRNSLNAGLTQKDSISALSVKNNVYYYTPLTSILEGCLEISDRTQINKDYFINTIGLDENRYDLDYINIEDEYGLPMILY